MSSVLVEGSVIRPKWGVLLAIPMVAAVVCAIALGVNLWIGEDRVPRELEGSTPWFAFATVGLSAVAAVLGWRGRVRVRVVEEHGMRVLQVLDPAAPLLLTLPANARYGWIRVPAPKGPDQTLLLVGIVADGACRVAFRETWGSAWAPPPTWPEGAPTLDAPVVYDTLAGSFLPRLVEVVEAPPLR